MDGTPLSPGPDLVGQVLGDRYRVIARLGQGGMGSIYLAEHVTLGKKMAVKVLRPEYSRDAELLDRFQHEARAASQIGQENIVEVFDFGHTPEGQAYFVMEALEGESLARVLHRDGPMALGRAVPIFLQICRALGAAHQRGIVHRDLKPENVFLLRRADGTDFVKVLDFGIAKGPGAPDAKRLTRAGSIIGTPEYMSPEQASANAIDQRSDVYAFGVLAYETLTGRLPFDGDTPLATLMKHQSDAPLPPRRIRPELPPEVEQIVLRALVKRPEGRQQSMEELAGELSRLAAGEPDLLRGPVFGTAVAPLLTGRTTGRIAAARNSTRGNTMPLGDTLPLADLAPPAPGPEPVRSSTRVRRDTRAEVEVASRRRSQLALAAVLGLLFVALLSGVVAAMAARSGEASRPAPPAPQEAAVRGEPPAVRVTSPDGVAPSTPVETATVPAPPTPVAEPAPAPHDPPPSASASAPPPPRTARPRPSRAPPGVGTKGASGENGPTGSDLIDPYGPTGR
ncbi:MAG TPA: serine/threonine-protein kinase [Anaeromyxobacteraceae bacterium]|nr:serine/threonine-protein kinase [Anaeromyxobacteraceae bacterium]